MKPAAALAPLFLLGLPAAAQSPTDPPKTFSVSGSAGLVTDYRFRGVSQSNLDPAVQGGVTVAHRSGIYGGFWGSNLAGWGQFGGANLELDLVGGYKRQVGNATLDVGVTWYMYPGGADETDFAEPFAKLSGTAGPATLLAGVAYAPPQQALGRWYRSGASSVAGVPDDPGDKEDNLYLWGDAAVAVPNTRATLKAHVGHSRGNKGLGPNGTSVTPTGRYWDWSAGVDYAVLGPVTIGLSYVDTDLTRKRFGYLLPNFSETGSGKTIAGSTVLLTAAASF